MLTQSETNTWSEVEVRGGTPPEPRSGHSAVVFKGAMYIFGGRDKKPQYFSDIRCFNFGDGL